MIKNSDVLPKLLGFIYDGFGLSEDYGVKYFLRYKKELLKYDPVDIISLQMEMYSHDYVLEFLMGASYVWEEFTSCKWVNLMRHLSPRPDPSRNIEPMSAYCDIVFLNRYVGVDAYSVYMADKEVSDLDKSRVESYFLIYPDLLKINELDRDDMDGKYLMSFEDMGRVRDGILKEGVFRLSNPVVQGGFH